MKDLYNKNFKTQKRETEEDENIPCSCVRKINTVKTDTLPKAIYRFKAIPIQITT